MHPLFDQPSEVCQALLWSVLGRSPLAVGALDENLIVRVWSDGAERLFGWSAAEVVDRAWSDIGIVADPIRQRQGDQMFAGVLAGTRWSGEWTGRRRDGSPVSVLSMAEPVRVPGSDDTVGVLFMSVDITSREEFEQALLRQAMHDWLTGLPNRALLLDDVSRLSQEGPGAVLFIDLDDFKVVNDEHGHATGDHVLSEVARRLRSAVRTGDIIGRVGGDEFVVLCPARGQDDAVTVGERIALRIAGALATPVGFGELQVRVSASVGVAVFGPDTDPGDLLARADAAMYVAKETGKESRRIDDE